MQNSCILWANSEYYNRRNERKIKILKDLNFYFSTLLFLNFFQLSEIFWYQNNTIFCLLLLNNSRKKDFLQLSSAFLITSFIGTPLVFAIFLQSSNSAEILSKIPSESLAILTAVSYICPSTSNLITSIFRAAMSLCLVGTTLTPREPVSVIIFRASFAVSSGFAITLII